MTYEGVIPTGVPTFPSAAEKSAENPSRRAGMPQFCTLNFTLFAPTGGGPALLVIPAKAGIQATIH